ncbi:MAG: ABC transporter permease [Candidatus Hydrogenedentes bacterium]|nr:ABC transporter permease [Candidatus Hydrogenedentota bacterium]
MLGRITALIIKELQAVWQDKKSRAVLIVPPIIQLLAFSYAATMEVRNVDLAVLNRDNGAESRELIDRFVGSPTFARVHVHHSEAELARAIDEQEALVAVQFGPEFSRELAQGHSAQMQLLLDGRRSNAAQLVQGYLLAIVGQYNRELQEKLGYPPMPSTVVARSWFNPNLDYQWFTVPSLIGILTMLIGLVVTALSVARERELGTFDQLLVSPLRPGEILLGKTLPALIIGWAEGTFILLAAVFFFRVPLTGSVPMLYVAMTAFLVSVIGVGLFVSSLCRTQQQAILGVFTFMSPAVLLSGFATPVENMPEWLQPITIINPLKYFLIILKGVFLKDMPADAVWANTVPLILIAALTLGPATWLFRRRLG